jgi:hypothetical protein
MGGVATVMPTPQGNRRDLTPRRQERHGCCVPHHRRRDRLGGEARTRVGGALDRLRPQGVNPLARSRLAPDTRQGQVGSVRTERLPPRASPRHGVSPEWHGPRLAAVAVERSNRAVANTDVRPRQPREFRDACARVIEGQEPCTLAPSHPRRSMRRCQQGLSGRSRQVAEPCLVRTRHRTGAHAGDQAAAVRITPGPAAEPCTESGQADRAGPHGVAARRRQIGEKAPHHRGLNRCHPPRRGRHPPGVSQARAQAPDRVPTAHDGVRTAPPLWTALVGNDGRPMGCTHVARPGASLPRGPRSRIDVPRRSGALARP